MKNLFYSIAIAASIFTASLVHAEPETKRVCVMQKDAKTGKEKEVCVSKSRFTRNLKAQKSQTKNEHRK